jgi:MtN3 and saliva related transmembrane protein
MEFSAGTIVGIVASCLTSFSYVPQVRKMWQRKSVEDVSQITMYQMVIGCLLWLAYGIFRIDWIIISANIVAITILFTALVLYYKFKRKS